MEIIISILIIVIFVKLHNINYLLKCSGIICMKEFSFAFSDSMQEKLITIAGLKPDAAEIAMRKIKANYSFTLKLEKHSNGLVRVKIWLNQKGVQSYIEKDNPSIEIPIFSIELSKLCHSASNFEVLECFCYSREDDEIVVQFRYPGSANAIWFNTDPRFLGKYRQEVKKEFVSVAYDPLEREYTNRHFEREEKTGMEWRLKIFVSSKLSSKKLGLGLE